MLSQKSRYVFCFGWVKREEGNFKNNNGQQNPYKYALRETS